MQCYNCGSEEGSDTSLCSECNKKRSQDLFSMPSFIRESYKLDRKTVLDIYKDAILRAVAGLGFLVAVTGVYCYFDSGTLPFTHSTAERVLRNCLDNAAKALETTMRGEKYALVEGGLFAEPGPMLIFLVQQFGEIEGRQKLDNLRAGDGSVCSELQILCSESNVPGCSTLIN